MGTDAEDTQVYGLIILNAYPNNVNLADDCADWADWVPEEYDLYLEVIKLLF